MQTDPYLLANARTLRKTMTEAEKKIWYSFLRKYPVRFYRQHVVDQYVIDFYCPKAKLAVEIDGGQHYEEEGQKSDALRTERLNQLGVSVIRYTNVDIMKRFAAVCEDIDNKMNGR